MIRSAVAINRVSMPGHNDFDSHLGQALHYRVEVVHLKPQQHTVSVRLVIAIPNRAMIVLNLKAVQLKDKPAIGDQPFIRRASMITPAT
jgi:hypothetical protein